MKTKKITLQMFSDPGHGWVRFPKKRLAKLGIADKISTITLSGGVQVADQLKAIFSPGK